jgi:uncharacterized protein YjaZ
MEIVTGPGMEIAVRDDAGALAELFTLPVGERFDALAGINGLAGDDASGREFLRRIHEQGDGFPVGVDDPRLPEALTRLVDADAWGQVGRQLEAAWRHQQRATPGLRHPARVDVVLTLGNPDSRLFVERTLGYYGIGAAPGSIWLCAWPTDYNLSRIGACAVHELAHNLRTTNVDGFGLAEWILQEGLAEALTLEVCGPDSTGAWYADVFGEQFDRVWQRVTGAFGSGTSLGDWAPYVLGDETAARFGREPAGVPHMGGYAVGRRIVERYLDATGLAAAEALVRPAEEILEVAGLPA